MREKIASYLLYPDRELPAGAGYPEKDEMIKDLNLKVIFQAASRPVWKEGDSLKNAEKEDFYIYESMKRIMLIPVTDRAALSYRQSVVCAALKHRELMRSLYQTAEKSAKFLEQSGIRGKENRARTGAGSGELLGSFEMLCGFVGLLEEIKELLEAEELEEGSGLYELKMRLRRAYPPDFEKALHEVLADMEFFTQGGKSSFAVGIGTGMKFERIMLRDIRSAASAPRGSVQKEGIFRRIFQTGTVAMTEEAVLREAKQLEEGAFRFVLSWFMPFFAELSDFFGAFRVHTAFLLGCVQLAGRMESVGVTYAFPTVAKEGKECFCFAGLYELSMAILMRMQPVTNALDANGCRMLVITGANQGGKSTCLRSLGIAQIMLQCGMFVPAAQYEGALYRNIFTHFTRREDQSMNSGRLDEELRRMDAIVRQVTKDSLILLNESFATTTEKEGSVIAMELVSALYENGIAVGMVTHLLAFARELYQKREEPMVFLSAQRKEDGTRTYRMVRQAPENTSFGLDLYEELIGAGEEKANMD